MFFREDWTEAAFLIQCLYSDSLWSLFQLQFSVGAACLCSGWSQTSKIIFEKRVSWASHVKKIHKNWRQNAVWPVRWYGSAGASLCTPPPGSLHSPPPGPPQDSDPEPPQHLRRLHCSLLLSIPSAQKRKQVHHNWWDLESWVCWTDKGPLKIDPETCGPCSINTYLLC